MTDLNLPAITVGSQEALAKLAMHADYLDIALLTRCCQLVENSAAPLEIPYAQSAITHGLTMADELTALRCDNITLAAAIIYPSFHHQRIDLETLSAQLDPNIAKLVNGVERIEAIQHLSSYNPNSEQQHQIDNLRKMSLAMADDVRIVLIKLAERLAVLKYLRHCSPEQQYAQAQQIMSIYAPLANRLGIGQFKWQLEDLSFRYLHHQEYSEISKALKMRRSDREAYIEQIISHLTNLLHKAQINNLSINGRAKHIYSIYRKIQRKQVDFSQIYDTSAVRVLVPTIKDCYTTLSVVHSEWSHIPPEFDDYIAKPKPNGYRSIHTVIIGPENINVEIQIRTFEMHDQSERGVAAHWRYKEGGGAQSTYEQKINWLRSVIDWQKQVSEPVADNLFKKTFEDRIYVLTPNGDIVDLEAGATPLDFAYHVHTDVGHRCRGAKVNNILVPLSHLLSTGDQVSILTGKEPHPSRDWLNTELGYLGTQRAINKVRTWFKRESQQVHLEKGQQLWEKAYRREGISKSSLEKIAAEFNFKTSQELLMAIGSGDIGLTSIINRIKHPEAQQETLFIQPSVNKKIKAKTTPHTHSSFVIEGVDDLLTQLGRCCKPIPGDSIIGYITKGRGVTIHQQDCRNIQNAVQRFPQRIMRVNWINEETNAYSVELLIESEDRNDLIRDISNIISNEKIPILGINSRIDHLTNTAIINLTIEIKGLERLRHILIQLRQMPGMTRVSRV